MPGKVALALKGSCPDLLRPGQDQVKVHEHAFHPSRAGAPDPQVPDLHVHVDINGPGGGQLVQHGEGFKPAPEELGGQICKGESAIQIVHSVG